MPTRRDVLKAGGGLAVLSALPMPAESADAQDVAVQVAVSGPSFGTRAPSVTPGSDYADIKNKLGCPIVRNSVQWSNLEASRGSYNGGNLDRTVDACQTVGLRILIPISGPKPGWAGGDFGPPLGADLASYVRVCREIAMRYRGRGTVL
jgi:hypothetical protein